MTSTRYMLNRSTSTWWIALLEGFVVLILGLLLFFAPRMTLIVLVQFLGIYWLISGIFSIIEIFAARRTTPWGWLLLYGIVGILAGLAVTRHPLLAAILIPTVLVIWLGIAGIILGVMGIIQGISGRGVWAVILGVLDIVIGILLLANPLTIALALPLVIGILAIIDGILIIIAALRLRGRAAKLEQEETYGPANR